MTARAWAFQQGVLWAMDFSHSVPAPVTARLAVRFAEVGRESVAPLARAMDLRDDAEIVQRFETGRRCFGGWLDGEIVTYGWLSLRDEQVGELERAYRMRSGDGYIWHCATLPQHRAQGLYAALLSCMTSVLRGEGVQRVWIGANLENVASLRAFARVGFQPIVQVAYVRLLRLCCLWMRTQPSAPSDLVSGARQMLTAPHERVWRGLAFGLRPAASPARRTEL